MTFALRSCYCLPWQSWAVTHWLVAELSVWFFNFLCFITKYGFHLESTKLRNVASPAPFFPPPSDFWHCTSCIGLSNPPDLKCCSKNRRLRMAALGFQIQSVPPQSSHPQPSAVRVSGSEPMHDLQVAGGFQLNNVKWKLFRRMYCCAVICLKDLLELSWKNACSIYTDLSLFYILKGKVLL